MATAADYPVSFGYGAQDGVYYANAPNPRQPHLYVGRYHRGNDRACPAGIPIYIGPYLIGWTGATGKAFGNHLHTQACTAGRQWADDVNPSMYEFKYGTVMQAGWHHQFGNYVMVRVGGVDITYAHLSKINVSANQVLAAPAQAAPKGGNEVADRGQVQRLYNLILFRNGDEGGLNNYTGKNANDIVADMAGSQERKNIEAQINWTREHAANLENIKNQQQTIINDLTTKLQNSEASTVEKTNALNNAIRQFQQCTTDLDASKNQIIELEVAKQKAVEEAKAANQPKTIHTPSLLVKIIMALLPKKT